MSIKYKWLAERLEQLVEKQIHMGIPKLPTEHELSVRYHVSRQTVRMALGILEEKGMIARRQGSGSHITGLLPDSRQNAVAILISSDQEYIYPGVLNDIQSALSAAGFPSRVFPTGNQVSAERALLELLVKNPPRGIIAEGCKTAFPSPNLELYQALMRDGCEIVFLYNYYPGPPVCLYIKDDNYAGSALLVQHLRDQGHTAVGGIFKYDDMQGAERYLGFVETMQKLGLSVPDSHVCWYGERELRRLMAEQDTSFLKSMAEEALAGCTAVICYNDIIAYHLISVLQLAGYQLPGDMAIAAFDNTYLSNSNILTVTTLSHKPHEMGTRAAQAMISRLKGLPAQPQEAPWKLNQKESTQSGV